MSLLTQAQTKLLSSESANTINHEHSAAFAMDQRHALAQLAATGCLRNTHYMSAAEQLETVLRLAYALEPEYVARVAVWSRTRGAMKEMPALLCAVLASPRQGADVDRYRRAFEKAFVRAIDSAKMLRRFVEYVRTGVTGKRSLGSTAKRLIEQWFSTRSPDSIFRQSVGSSPSLVDVIKLAHPKPSSPEHEALFGYLLDNDNINVQHLPETVQRFQEFAQLPRPRPDNTPLPPVPFELLTSMQLSPAEWSNVALNMTYNQLRQNLNVLIRNRVFHRADVAELIAQKLADRSKILSSGVLPYQLLTTYNFVDNPPAVIRRALETAIDIATASVVKIEGNVVVCIDVSGSMRDPVSGSQQGATTKVRCTDVAALMAATIVNNNPQAKILPFSDRVHTDVVLSRHNSIVENANFLANLSAGGTNCSCPLTYLNQQNRCADLVIYLSDYESWLDDKGFGRNNGTGMFAEWNVFRWRNPNARLVCIDLRPNTTLQTIEREEILNIGGFSDVVFEVVQQFATGQSSAGHWTELIDQIEL